MGVAAFGHGQQRVGSIDGAEREPARLPQAAELPQRSAPRHDCFALFCCANGLSVGGAVES